MDAQALTFRKVPWSQRVAKGIARAGGADLNIIGQEVIDNVSEAWEIDGCGFVITRLEQTDFGPELVLVAGEGRGGMQVVPALQRVASRVGATMRIHSERNGMGRYLRPLGFELREVRGKESVYGWKE